MILRGTQIQRRGHGKCGLFSDRVRSSNLTELAHSGLVSLIAIHLCESRIFLSPLDQEEVQ